MKRKSILIFIGSFAFLLLTSVYCTRHNTCTGVVLDAQTLQPLDSVHVNPSDEKMVTQENGRYEVHFTTHGKAPVIQFDRAAYLSKEANCKQEDTIKLEQ